MEIAAFVSVVILMLVLGVIIATGSKEAQISISERAAARRSSYLVFAFSLSIFGSLFLFYLWRSFGTQFGLPPSYYAGLFSGWAFLLLTAWIPDRGPRSFRNPHWQVALGLACSMTIMAISFACAQHMTEGVRWLSIAISLWYCYTLYIWLFNTKAFQLYLRFETMNLASFIGLLALAVIFR